MGCSLPKLFLSEVCLDFDTFVWVKQVYSIPSGCTVFTDGSLLDNKLPKEGHALGWAFSVVNQEGEYVCSAHGVPPYWIDTIQGAELWAVVMALLNVTFPEGLYTDCDSVRTGANKGPVWAQSAKRRYARAWATLASIIEGAQDMLHWMPAHSSEASIGSVKCSDGSFVDGLKWYSNQMVDFLAREAAEGVRIPAQCRKDFLLGEKQLKEFLIYLGKLTYEVNNFQSSEGVIRDSDAKQRRRVKKSTRKQNSTKTGKSVRTSTTCGTSVFVRGQSCRGLQDRLRSTVSAKQGWMGRAKLASLEASFFKSWRAERAISLKPSGLCSAAERISALKARVIARGANGP